MASLLGSSETKAIVKSGPPPPEASSDFSGTEFGIRLSGAGRYSEARDAFRAVAHKAERAGVPRIAAINWNDAGACSLLRHEFQPALNEFLRAKQEAELAQDTRALVAAINNLANLYNQTGDPQAALAIAQQALSGPPAKMNEASTARLRYQVGHALAALKRMDEAEPFYRESISDLERSHDFDAATRVRGNFGIDLIEAERYAEAEAVLNDGLAMVRAHNLPSLGNLLRGLARVKGHEGKPDAEKFFQAAIDAPPAIAPRWNLFADRGEYRLDKGNTLGALADFREAHRLALNLRVDVVPADQNRVALESSLHQVMDGVVDAGNQLALRTRSASLSEETFNAAEQDRLWSLRVLVPVSNDWRSHLPTRYWDVLARYRATPATSPEGSADLRAELDQLEAAAGAATPEASRNSIEPALHHIRAVLAHEAPQETSVLLSFHFSERGAWLWAVDGTGSAVYALPSQEVFRAKIAKFVTALRKRDPESICLGSELYSDLLGDVAPRYLKHQRWLLELDGPLFDLPFGAVMPPSDSGPSVYLAERKILELIPSVALFGQENTPEPKGGFVGIGDAIYNTADSRYRGNRSAALTVLPRLPGTASELNRCAVAWGAADSHLLIGQAANSDRLASAIAQQPAILHFAAHVIPSSLMGTTERSTGLIALSLNRSGKMDFLGPAEIAARPLTARLVVLDGCDSGAGTALPSSGLQGLTRAWIGAGARAVMATRWDVPDNDSFAMMATFYRNLRKRGSAHPAEAFADTQGAMLKDPAFRSRTDLWAAYFVLGRQ